MSKYERRQMFEEFCELRSRYADRGDEDRRAVLSIADAIAWAEDLLDLPVDAPDTPAEAEAA